MQKGIIGKKLGMTQLFDANGKVVPVTIIEAGPCTVVQKKTVESDGYQAVQMLSLIHISLLPLLPLLRQASAMPSRTPAVPRCAKSMRR